MDQFEGHETDAIFAEMWKNYLEQAERDRVAMALLAEEWKEWYQDYEDDQREMEIQEIVNHLQEQEEAILRAAKKA